MFDRYAGLISHVETEPIKTVGFLKNLEGDLINLLSVTFSTSQSEFFTAS